MLVWREREPQIVKRFPLLNSGAKKGIPWMWSQWAWVRKMSPVMGCPSPRSRSARPSSRIPVPASRMMSQPSPVRSSTQGVLPPYRTVEGPGVGIEPRVPQKVRRQCYIAPADHIRTWARFSSAGRLATAMRRRSTRMRPSVLEVLHGAGDRLAARADHLRDRLMRERLLDRSRWLAPTRDRAAGGRCGRGRRAAPARRSSRRRGAGGATAP